MTEMNELKSHTEESTMKNLTNYRGANLRVEVWCKAK